MLAAVLLAGWAAAAVRASEAPAGEPVRMWSQLRAAYADYLSAPPTEAVGLRAAEFLRSSSVTLAAGDLKSGLGEGTFAAYDLAERTIRLDRRGLQEVWLSLESAELQPGRARPFIERTAPAVVHELKHASDHAALGAVPLFREWELSACWEQALFLRRRLELDAGYRGLGELDRALAEHLKEKTKGSAAWFRRPLEARDLRGLEEAGRAARRLLPERVTSQELNDWYFVRSLAAGPDAFEANLRRAGYLGGPSVFVPGDGEAASARRRVESIRRQLAVLTFNSLPDSEKERRAVKLQAALSSAETALRFWEDPRAVARAADYFRKELDDRRRNWDGLSAAKAPGGERE